MDPMYGYPYHHMESYYSRPDAVPVPPSLMYTRPPFNNTTQYWPWGSGYPYPPAAYPGCCNHNSWRPPYSHIPSPCYPPFPTLYAPPPPCAYNNAPRDQHCCGCPNHLCSQKEQTSLKIEEEMPQREQVNQNAPVASLKFNNSPYSPIVWFPADHGDNKEHQSDSKHVSSPNTEPEKQPGGWFDWYPFESNKSGSPKEKIGGHESYDGKGRFQYPMYWMPYMSEEREKEKPTRKNVDPKLSLEPPKEDSEEKAGGQPCTVVKEIPVKDLKPHEENLASSNKQDQVDSSIKDKDVLGTYSRENVTKIDPKRKSSSAPKSSKLPPVCLRVDPLPRRKDMTSPSVVKKKTDQVSNEVRKVPSPDAPKEKPDQVTNKESKEGKGATKSIKVVDANTSQEERPKNQTEEKHDKERIPAESQSNDAVMKVQTEDTCSARAQNGDVSNVKEEAKTLNKSKLSEADAAVIIQAAYRGFDIRRWEPVKKLKEIARVREQISEVSNLIRAMELSSDIRGDSKQRNIIVETIMSLLLKLDMIQGLHPSVREVRKSVVRELVSLQEKLDALINEKSEVPQDQESVAAKQDEYDFRENVNITSSPDSNKPCQNQLNETPNKASESQKIVVNKNPDYEASEVSESKPGDSGSAIEPTNRREDEQSSQTGEISLTKEDDMDSVLVRGTKCSVDEVVDSATNDKEKTETGHPLEVVGDILGQSDAEIGEHEPARQPDEGLKEAYNPESNRGNCEVERDYTESSEQLGDVLGNISTVSDAIVIPNPVDGLLEEGCTLREEFETTKHVGSGYEPAEHSDQLSKSVFSDILESPEVADKKDNPMAEKASNVEDADSNTSQADPSITEEAQTVLHMKENEANREPIKESTDIGEMVADELSSYEQCSLEQREEARSEEHFLLEKNCKVECVDGEDENEEELTPEIRSVAAGNVNGISRDEKLLEEKEKLRDMVEKMVKLGEEQFRVISSLSGRVKHLERNLSKKRKLKVKPHKQREKKPASLKEWT